MINTEVQINLSSQVATPIIQAVQGDTGRSVTFVLSDLVIPSGAEATYYVAKPSGECVYNVATISGNSIICDLTAQSLAEVGENNMQVRVLADGKVVTSFEALLMVRAFIGYGAVESSTESTVFDKYFENAKEEFHEAAQEVADKVIQTIPADYTKLTKEVGQLNERFDVINSALNDDEAYITTSPTIYNNKSINNDGIEIDENNYSLTDYIDVANASKFKVVGMNKSIYINYCAYDNTKTKVGNNTRIATDTDVSISDEAKYIRITTTTTNMTAGYIQIYEPTKIFELSERISKLEDAEKRSASSVIPNSGIVNGQVYTNSGFTYVLTDYLPLNDFLQDYPITMQGTFYGSAGAAIYDSDKNLLYYINGNNAAQYGATSRVTLQQLELPFNASAEYIRITASTASSSDYTEPSDLWVEGTTMHGIQAISARVTALEDEIDDIQTSIEGEIHNSKVLVIGDSISTDNYGNYKKWVTVLKEQGFLPSDTNNDSIHATGFVATTGLGNNDFITRIKAVQNPEEYGLLIVFGGINDYIQNIPMGSDAGTDYTVSFKPAVNEFFSYMTTEFVQARLCVILPLRTSNTAQNTAGQYQQAYSDYIKSVAKSYCLPILNLTEDSGFYPWLAVFRDKWTLLPSGYQTADGVHPNEEYERRFLAPMIKHFLQGLM